MQVLKEKKLDEYNGYRALQKTIVQKCPHFLLSPQHKNLRFRLNSNPKNNINTVIQKCKSEKKFQSSINAKKLQKNYPLQCNNQNPDLKCKIQPIRLQIPTTVNYSEIRSQQSYRKQSFNSENLQEYQLSKSNASSTVQNRSYQNIQKNINQQFTSDIDSEVISINTTNSLILNRQKLQYSAPEKKFENIMTNIKKKIRTQSFQVNSKFALISKSSIYDFEILNCLGAGVTAKVYLVRHKILNMLFALKVIKKQYFESQIDIAKSIEREIKIQYKIKDPNVISLYDVFSDDKKIYLVMEYLDGGNLYDLWINKNKKIQHFKEQTVSQIVGDICKGLKALHQKHIIHRDLKLQNIMLQCGVAKIGDLGCAIETILMQNAVIGSPIYLSPEQLSQHFYNSKIDMWSLGIITFELIYGFSPFQKDIHEILVNKHKSNILPHFKFPQSRQVSETAKNFISKLLEHNISKRLDANEALEHPFLKNIIKKEKLRSQIYYQK